MNNKLPKRKSIRLKEYDYSLEGYYFITICTKNRKEILGHIKPVGVALLGDPKEKTIEQIELTNEGKIVNKHINNCNIEQLSVKEYPNVPPPKEMEWFQVDPCKIDKKLFEEKRVDEEQEKIRQLILEAFDVVEREKEKYGKKFKTYIPLPSFKINQGLEDVIKEAQEHGDHLADWVEQAVEWGQRIANGEKWETICNEADTIGCYRIIKGKY